MYAENMLNNHQSLSCFSHLSVRQCKLCLITQCSMTKHEIQMTVKGISSLEYITYFNHCLFHILQAFAFVFYTYTFSFSEEVTELCIIL